MQMVMTSQAGATGSGELGEGADSISGVGSFRVSLDPAGGRILTLARGRQQT